MNTANEITEELNNLGSNLAGISRAMPFSVPAGYFENLPGQALIVACGPDPVLNVGKTMTLSTPEGYFESLTDNIMSAVKTAHIQSVSSKEMPYAVPSGFFDTFPNQVLQAAQKDAVIKKTATRIPLGQRNSFTQIRWAAAAVLLICIGFGGYETFYTRPNNTENMLAAVPNNDIKDYLQHTYVLDVNQIVNSTDINNIDVDNKDIIQYLNETGWDMTE